MTTIFEILIFKSRFSITHIFLVFRQHPSILCYRQHAVKNSHLLAHFIYHMSSFWRWCRKRKNNAEKATFSDILRIIIFILKKYCTCKDKKYSRKSYGNDTQFITCGIFFKFPYNLCSHDLLSIHHCPSKHIRMKQKRYKDLFLPEWMWNLIYKVSRACLGCRGFI